MENLEKPEFNWNIVIIDIEVVQRLVDNISSNTNVFIGKVIRKNHHTIQDKLTSRVLEKKSFKNCHICNQGRVNKVLWLNTYTNQIT